MLRRANFIWFVIFFASSALGYHHGAMGFDHGFVRPVADTTCIVTTGNCTGVGSGSALFTAAGCNGSADDVAAFNSFNAWATGTWQVAHPGLLLELDIPSGSVCNFISGNVNSNKIAAGILRFQLVGYGATLTDNHGTGGGFFLGCQVCGVQFNGTASTARLVTVSAGASCVTLITPADISKFTASTYTLIAGIDPQGFGDPPNPQIFEWIFISSLDAAHQCNGSTAGASVHFSTPLQFSYESTWPSYNAGDAGHSDQGGPATLYALGGVWNITHAYYGLTIDQRGAQTNANGMAVSFRDIGCGTSGFCVIPSQNLNYSLTNVTATSTTTEFDKIVSNITQTNINFRRILVQSAGQNWTCTDCTVGPIGVSGTAGVTTFVRGNIADLSIGAIAFGVSGSFTATNTVISSLETAGANQSNIDTVGVWSGSTLTVPQNMTVSAAASCGTTCTQFTVTSTAGWSNGLTIPFGAGSCGQYTGTLSITIIDSTHFSIPQAFVSTCSGSIGNLPLNWAIPRANVYFNGGSHGSTVGPMLQVADLSVGANNATVVSFNKNGLPLSGGLPTMPGGPPFSITAHPAPSWSCTGCTGAINVTDITGVPTGPYGSQATRIVTASNSGNATAMPIFGPLSELDMTVTAACGAASNIGFEQTMFTATLGSVSFGSWNPTANALVSSATPRVVTPTTSSGAQSGDSLVTPGTGTLILTGQTIPFYSAVGNCGSASTTVTVKTNQGVVYP
jgi:hypothetical protein